MLVGHFDRNNSSVEIVSSQVALIFVQMTKTNQHHWFFVNLFIVMTNTLPLNYNLSFLVYPQDLMLTSQYKSLSVFKKIKHFKSSNK